MRYYKGFSITGSANSTVYDTGIASTDAEKRRLIGVLLSVSDIEGNVLQAFEGQERIVEDLYDYLLDTIADTGSTNVQFSTSKMQMIEIGRDLPVQDVFKMAIQCGANATDLYGAYVYEVIG